MGDTCESEGQLERSVCCVVRQLQEEADMDMGMLAS